MIKFQLDKNQQRYFKYIPETLGGDLLTDVQKLVLGVCYYSYCSNIKFTNGVLGISLNYFSTIFNNLYKADEFRPVLGSLEELGYISIEGYSGKGNRNVKLFLTHYADVTKSAPVTVEVNKSIPVTVEAKTEIPIRISNPEILLENTVLKNENTALKNENTILKGKVVNYLNKIKELEERIQVLNTTPAAPAAHIIPQSIVFETLPTMSPRTNEEWALYAMDADLRNMLSEYCRGKECLAETLEKAATDMGSFGDFRAMSYFQYKFQNKTENGWKWTPYSEEIQRFCYMICYQPDVLKEHNYEWQIYKRLKGYQANGYTPNSVNDILSKWIVAEPVTLTEEDKKNFDKFCEMLMDEHLTLPILGRHKDTPYENEAVFALAIHNDSEYQCKK